jgi:hypothetical protein
MLKPGEEIEQHSGKQEETKTNHQPAIIWSAAGLVQHCAAEGAEMKDTWLAQLLLIIDPELGDDAALAVRTFNVLFDSHNVPQSNLADDVAILLLLSSLTK